MRLHDVLPVVIAFLQRERRVTYRALQRDFGFDMSLLDDIRHELMFKRLAMDEHGQGLVWTGGPIESPDQTSASVSARTPMERASPPSSAGSLSGSDDAPAPTSMPPHEMHRSEPTTARSISQVPDTVPSQDTVSPPTEVESTLADAIEPPSHQSGQCIERGGSSSAIAPKWP